MKSNEQILDTLSGLAIGSPPAAASSSVVSASACSTTAAAAERLTSSNSDEDGVDESQQCYLPSVLRDRPLGGRAGGRGAPPPVPPRSPRRPTDSASNRGGH